VAFVPGPSFFPGPDEQVGGIRSGAEFARLAFTFADEEGIDEGCRRFGRALA
jgi:DNA-binding transcriptional MocR family regulator